MISFTFKAHCPRILVNNCTKNIVNVFEDWEWLYKHFTDPKFVKKYVAGKKARESKTLLHHSSSKPFSYRLQARREEGSTFLDLFTDVYVRLGNETTEQLHGAMVEKSIVVLQETTSQLPL